MAPTQTVALLGMPGSGKSTAAAHLALLGVPTYRLGGAVVSEVVRQGLAVTPENEAAVRTALRAEHGPTVLAARALTWLARRDEPIAVLDGVYSMEEYQFFKARLQNSLTTIALVSDREVRTARLTARVERPLTRDEAESRDHHEIAHLRKSDAIVMADHFLTNNGPEREMQDRLIRICMAHWSHSPSVEMLLDTSIDQVLQAVAHSSLTDRPSLTALMHRAIVTGHPHLMWHACSSIGMARAEYGLTFLRWIGDKPDVAFDDTTLHRIAAKALAEIDGDVDYLISTLTGGNADQRVFAADALGEMRADQAVGPLLTAVESDDLSVALWAALSLAKIGSDSSRDELEVLSRRLEGSRRLIAFDALVRLDSARASRLMEEIESKSPLDETVQLRRRLSAAER